jgi:hypothetical protein
MHVRGFTALLAAQTGPCRETYNTSELLCTNTCAARRTRCQGFLMGRFLYPALILLEICPHNSACGQSHLQECPGGKLHRYANGCVEALQRPCTMCLVRKPVSLVPVTNAHNQLHMYAFDFVAYTKGRSQASTSVCPPTHPPAFQKHSPSAGQLTNIHCTLGWSTQMVCRCHAK